MNSDNVDTFRRPYRFAFVMGSIPLIGGTAVFLGWKLTRRFGFAELGIPMLLVGFVMVSVGLIGVGIEWYKNRDNKDYSFQKAISPLALLLSNIPVAAYYAHEGLADLTNDFTS